MFFESALSFLVCLLVIPGCQSVSAQALKVDLAPSVMMNSSFRGHEVLSRMSHAQVRNDDENWLAANQENAECEKKYPLYIPASSKGKSQSLSQSGEASRCQERWGYRLLDSLSTSSRLSSFDGESFTLLNMLRSGAPHAEGSVSMAVFSSNAELSHHDRTMEPLKNLAHWKDLEEQLSWVLPIVQKWRSTCTSTSMSAKSKTLFLLPDKYGGKGNGNMWHRLASIFPLWLSRVLLKKHCEDVSLFVRNAEAVQQMDLLQTVSTEPPLVQSDVEDATRMCDFSEVVFPLWDGFLWDLAWDQSFDCDTQNAELVKDFAEELMCDLGVSAEVHAKDKVRICLMHRGSSGNRILTNEKEILNNLAQGWDGPVEVVTLLFEVSQDMKDQVEQAHQCDVLVGVHGAGLTHLLWLHKHSTVVEILPEKSGFAYFKNLAMLSGAGYLGVGAPSQGEGYHYVTPSIIDVRTAVQAAAYTAGLKRNILSPESALKSSLSQVCSIVRQASLIDVGLSPAATASVFESIDESRSDFLARSCTEHL